MDRIKIIVVDDHPILREGLAAIIANHPEIDLAGEANNGLEAIELFRTVRPDVTFMDLQMPGMTGIETIIAIRKEFPDARIVVLTTYRGDVQAIQAIQAGAYGYLLKTSLRKELLETIRIVHSGRRRIHPDIAHTVAEHQGSESLTARELEVLQLIAAGNANKIIASHLLISDETVKGHVRSILSKLNANDRTHAVTIGLKRGIILLDDSGS